LTPRLERLPGIALALVTLLIVTLCVAGGVRNYTPVPFWDMWDALQLQFTKGASGLLDLHNEHRIVFARLLFMMDLGLFKGSQVFLLVVNYLLAGLSALLLILITRRCIPEPEGRALRFALTCLIISLCYAWSQRENFIWAFQSQFFLAQQLPLLAFYLLYLSSAQERHRTLLFALASLTGIACAGTMANGVLALPIMAVLALFLGLGRSRALLLGVLGAFVCGLYFLRFQSPGQQESLPLSHPLQLLHYLLAYLGGPGFHVTGSSRVAVFGGLFMLGSCLYFAVLALTQRRNDRLLFLLLAFLLYIGISAVGVASARLLMGIEQAFSSRYATPTLMAWIVLLLIYARVFHFAQLRPSTTVIAVLLLSLTLLPQQRHALENNAADIHARMLGALAVEMGINDEDRIRLIYPFPHDLLQHAPPMARAHYAVYNDERLRDALLEQDKPAQPQWTQAPRCAGFVDSISPLANDPGYLYVQGWMYDTKNKAVPSTIRIIDQQGVVVGRAFTGIPRPDVRREIGKRARYSGFSGYISNKAARGDLLLAGGGARTCTISGQFKSDAFSVRPSSFSVAGNFASVATITSRQGWGGSDPQYSSAPGYDVIGTFNLEAKSPRNVLTLSIVKGQSIYYRSSAVGQHNLYIADHEKEFLSLLPISPDWMILDFNRPELPQRFTVVISDDSPSNEAWSAVALQSSPAQARSLAAATASRTESRNDDPQ